MLGKYIYGCVLIAAGIAGAVLFGQAKLADADRVAEIRESGTRVEAIFGKLKCVASNTGGRGSKSDPTCNIEMRIDDKGIQLPPTRVGISYKLAQQCKGVPLHMDDVKYPVIVNPAQPREFIWDGPCAQNSSTGGGIAVIALCLCLSAGGVAYILVQRSRHRRARLPG